MTRRIIMIFCFIIIAIIIGMSIFTQSVRSSEVNNSIDAAAVRETILNARSISIKAEYNFDTSKYNLVYINDSRGGKIPDEALAQIREIRHDPSIQKDEVGFLDYKIIVIEKIKRDYENYMQELRFKKETGTLTGQEQAILEGETYGWPTSIVVVENLSELATQACELFQTRITSHLETATAMPSPTKYAGYSTAYPEPPTPSPGPVTATPLYGTVYPGPEDAPLEPQVIHCPTSTPTPLPIDVPIRGADPATLSQDEFTLDIYSIDIDGDIARAIVHKRAVTSEYTLVKVDGRWYIAGAKLLSLEP